MRIAASLFLRGATPLLPPPRSSLMPHVAAYAVIRFYVTLFSPCRLIAPLPPCHYADTLFALRHYYLPMLMIAEAALTAPPAPRQRRGRHDEVITEYNSCILLLDMPLMPRFSARAAAAYAAIIYHASQFSALLAIDC